MLGGIYLCALPTFTYGGRDLVAMLQVRHLSFIHASGLIGIYLVVFMQKVDIYLIAIVVVFLQKVDVNVTMNY